MCLSRLLTVVWAALLPVFLSSAQELHISGEKIRAHVKYLSSDELEGRGVGTRGERLATEYLASQLKLEGVKPGGENGSYFQRVLLVGATTSPNATLTVKTRAGSTTLHYLQDFVGT